MDALITTLLVVALFVFVAFSLPMLTLELGQFGSFYSSLVGIR